MENLGAYILRLSYETRKQQESNVKMGRQKQWEWLSYLSKRDSMVEEGMGLVDSGW